MNLNRLASGVVAVVQPKQPLTLRLSSGSTTSADGTRVPAYEDPITVSGAVQPLQWRDLMQLDGLNIQGTKRKVYLDGSINGVERLSQKGGDLITDSNGRVWLVVQVLEQWPEWVSAAVVLQTEG